MFRRLTVRVFVPAMTAVAIAAPAASAMPAQDTTMHATRIHTAVHSPALVDAAAHAATIRAIGARIASRECA